MRIVIALGGNALLRRSDPMTTEVQRRNIRIAAEAIAPLAAEHSIVVVHGNGPQVGLLSLQAEAYKGAEPYPLDVLDAGTQGMIGYLIQQELRSLLPPEQPGGDPAHHDRGGSGRPGVRQPDEVRRPRLRQGGRRRAGRREGLGVPAGRRRPGGGWCRRPSPGAFWRSQPITWLLERGAVVICAGGGGIPTMYPSSGPGALVGVEAVIDKDLASELLAEDVGADLFLMATDVDGVYLHWGQPEQRRLDQVTPEELAGYEFAAGSMGPKVEAAARFTAKTGRRAAIGSLADIAGIVGRERPAPTWSRREAAAGRRVRSLG